MSLKDIPYNNFSKFVLRTPLFSVDFFKSITKEDTIDVEVLKSILRNDKRVREAIFLASPSLLEEINKWLDGKLNDEKSEKIEFSVLKYLSRMSSRCTPFGLFAGTALGEFSNQTKIELQPNVNNARHTRLDMNYLVALTQNISKTEDIRNQLKFYPNTSLYKVGQQYRYIEYTYVGTKRVHHIIGVNYNNYLEKILEAAKDGKTINELANIILDEDVNLQDATDFVIELTESQILISELEPSVSGNELLTQILKVLKELKHTRDFVAILNQVDRSLSKLDHSITNDSNEYKKINQLLEPLNTSFDLKYLFQTDMTIAHRNNTLDYSLARKIKKTFKFLNKLSSVSSKTQFHQFQEAFFERYETKPVSLSKALDKDIGIGFVQDNTYGDVNLLIDDLNLLPSSKKASSYEVTTNHIETILHRKLIECITSNSTVLYLKDNDFETIEESWDDLPDTMSSMVEIVNVNGIEKIHMNYVVGSSAANLLGRFCHGDKQIETYVRSMVEIEKEINKDKLIAEIVHLPEARVGNVLFRPHLRDYEIPYLANSIINPENQIKIDDLEIVAESSSRLVVKSIKHNKEVIPRLSTAHNYSYRALPVYQFLASAQNIGKRNVISFEWGNLEKKFDFLPRVEYNDVILSYKLWNIKKKDIQPLLDTREDDTDFKNIISQFKASKKLPDLVMLKDSDNELLINLNNLLSVRMLLDTVKKRTSFQLKEFLHDQGIVKEASNSFSNQIIVSFFNEHKLNKDS